MCACGCVCVRERVTERRREGGRKGKKQMWQNVNIWVIWVKSKKEFKLSIILAKFLMSLK